MVSISYRDRHIRFIKEGNKINKADKMKKKILHIVFIGPYVSPQRNCICWGMLDDSSQNQKLTWKPGTNIYQIAIRFWWSLGWGVKHGSSLRHERMKYSIMPSTGPKRTFWNPREPTWIIRLIWISASEGQRKIFSATYFGNWTIADSLINCGMFV